MHARTCTCCAQVDIINEKFAEAREEIEFAREDAGGRRQAAHPHTRCRQLRAWRSAAAWPPPAPPPAAAVAAASCQCHTETVYFNDSADEARRVVGEVLDRWAALLQRLPADEQAKLQRAMGLKMEQLRAELRELDELHA